MPAYLPDRPAIKGRVIARFPARVWGSDGVRVTKDAGAYTIANDWGALAIEPSVSAPSRTYFPVYLEADGANAEAMRRISFAVLVLAVAGAVDLDALAAALVGEGYGAGDMLKSVYDADDDGVVDIAAAAPWDGITDLPVAVAAIGALTPAVDRLPYYTGVSGADLAVLTAFGRLLLAASNASSARDELGLGTAATYAANALPVSTATQNALDAKSPITRTIRTVSGTSANLVVGDAGNVVHVDSGSGKTVSIPTNASVPFPVGTQIDILSTGGGSTALSAAGGVSLVTDNGRTSIAGTVGAATLLKVGTDSWLGWGALA